MSWFKRPISHAEYITAFFAGMNHALRLNSEFNQIFINKRIEEGVGRAKADFESIIQRHKNRVEKAASPYIVTLYDRVSGLLQEAEQDKDSCLIKKYTAQLEVLELLTNVEGAF